MAQTFSDMLQNGIKELSALEDLGGQLVSKGVKTTQIRRFFGGIKRIQADFANMKGEIILLEPRLAYSVGKAQKDSKEGLNTLYKKIGPLIKEIDGDAKKFKNFVNIVEAVVAYHKAKGGAE